MQTFSAPHVPHDAPPWFQSWANAFAQEILRAANAGNDGIPGRYLNAEPAKPQDGWEYRADGTNWNPGSGKGAYRCSVSGTTVTYTLLG
jgi:hypothetical protein